MRVSYPDDLKMKNVVLAEANDIEDLSKFIKKAKYKDPHPNDPRWAGGSMASFHEKAVMGDDKYMAMADKYVDEFANLALEDVDIDLEYNTQVGILDYQAAMAGDAACLFGPAEVETDRAPVHVYMDGWTSCTVKTQAMTMRGVAMLAFARAVSIYRPVLVTAVCGMGHMPTRSNVIITVPIPTAPLDVSVASWALGSPQLFRCGGLGAVWELAKSSKMCGIPRLSDATWQQQEMGNWLAEREGVTSVVHLPFMMDNGKWDSEEYCLGWVKQMLKKYMQPHDYT